MQHVDAELEKVEKELTIDGPPAPPAYVMVTNLGAVHALDSTVFTDIGLACGFKISRLCHAEHTTRSILELVDAREKHLELHWLRKALHRQQTVPSTFDDRLLEEPRNNALPRLLIGSTYLIPLADGREVLAVLTDAVVLEPERSAYGTYRCADGTHVMCKNPLSDAEMAAVQRSPQTFFGIIKDVSHEINEPLDAFDFFWRSHSETPKEKLLEFTSNWPDAAALHQLEQSRLAQVYLCALCGKPLGGARPGQERFRLAIKASFALMLAKLRMYSASRPTQTERRAPSLPGASGTKVGSSIRSLAALFSNRRSAMRRLRASNCASSSTASMSRCASSLAIRSISRFADV